MLQETLNDKLNVGSPGTEILVDTAGGYNLPPFPDEDVHLCSGASGPGKCVWVHVGACVPTHTKKTKEYRHLALKNVL